MADDEVKQITLTIEGSPLVVDTVVTLMRFIEACGRHGTTRWVELMVDGDGGGQIDLRVDGEARPLDDAEAAFLLAGEGEGTPALRRQYVSTEHGPECSVLKIELV